MSVQEISDAAVLDLIATASRPPSTAELATRFEVIPSSPTLAAVLKRLEDGGRIEQCWKTTR